MIEVQIYIPVANNTGKSFEPERDKAFEMELINLFGGFSRLPGDVTGQWLGNDRRIFSDLSRVYVVSIESLGDGGLIRVAAEFAKWNYEQEAIYVRFLGLSEIF